MSKKQIAIIILVILGLVIFIVGLYLLFMKKPATTPTIDEPTFPTSTSTPTQPGISTTTPDSQSPTITSPASIPVLNKLSLAPVAGADFFYTRISTSTTLESVRYTDRATGQLYEIAPTGQARNRLSNTTIPQIQQVFWGASSTVIYRKIDASDTAIQTLSGVFSSTTIRTTNIPGAISSLALSPKKDRVFLVVPSSNNTGTAVISSMGLTNAKELTTLPINEFIAQWPKDSTVTLTTKAASGVGGYLYFLDTTKGTFTKILGNVSGLTTNTGSSTNMVLYTYITANDIPVTQAFNVAEKASVDPSVQTFSEKCVWSNKYQTLAYCAVPTSIKAGTYPDDWYKGNTLFVDNIYQVDFSSGLSTLLYSLPSNEAIDVISPSLDPTDTYMTFINKRDYSLWSLNIGSLVY